MKDKLKEILEKQWQKEAPELDYVKWLEDTVEEQRNLLKGASENMKDDEEQIRELKS